MKKCSKAPQSLPLSKFSWPSLQWSWATGLKRAYFEYIIYSLLAIAVAFGCLKKALFAIEKPKGHWFASNTGKVCSFEFADAAALTLCCWRTLTSPVPRLSVSYFDRHWFKWNRCICWIQFYPFELHQGISISSWLHELTCVVLQTDMNSREWCVKESCYFAI